MRGEVQPYKYDLAKLLDYKGYHVPDYQRDYSWSDKSASDLWEDLMMVCKDTNNNMYMLGSMVVAETTRGTEIVDGQQRLVTLTLMLCALRDGLVEILADENNVQYDDIIKEIDRTEYIEFISFPDPHVQKVLDNIVKGKTNTSFKKGPRSRMIKNYSLFRERTRELCTECNLANGDKLSGLLKIKNIIRNLKNMIYVVHITLPDEDQAFQVFQTLNSRGAALHQADLIKSHLVRHSKDGSKVNKRWKDMFGDIETPDKIIYDSVMSRTGDTIPRLDLYKNAKKCTDDDSINEYLDKLEEDVDIIRYIDDPDSLDKKRERDRVKLINLFHGLNNLKITYFRRPIIAACREWSKDSIKTLELTDCLLKFFFMYRTVCDFGIDKLKYIERTITKQIIDDGDFGKILWNILINPRTKKNYVVQKYFEQQLTEFVSNLKRKNAVSHYILASIEFQRQAVGSQIKKDLYDLEIEHIFPQKPVNSTWSNLTELNEHLHRLGNLTLVPAGWNKIFRNKSFLGKKCCSDDMPESKKVCYARCEVAITREINDEEWTTQTVKHREAKLIKFGVDNIWKLLNYAKRVKKPLDS